MAIMIVEALDDSRCKMLFEGVPFEVKGELIRLVNRMCDAEKLSMCKTNNDSLIVDGDALFALRSSTISTCVVYAVSASFAQIYCNIKFKTLYF